MGHLIAILPSWTTFSVCDDCRARADQKSYTETQRSVRDDATQRRRVRNEVKQRRQLHMTHVLMPLSFPRFSMSEAETRVERRAVFTVDWWERYEGESMAVAVTPCIRTLRLTCIGFGFYALSTS